MDSSEFQFKFTMGVRMVSFVLFSSSDGFATLISPMPSLFRCCLCLLVVESSWMFDSFSFH